MILNVELATCWETVYLGDVLGYIGNGLTNKQNKVKDGYPVTRIETISDDYINTKKVGYVDALLTEKVEKYRLRYGDILISHINSDPQLGRSVIYKGMPELLLHGMNLLRMRADPEKLDPFFLDYIFRFYRNRGVFISIASRAVGQSSINQRRMTALTIPLPPLPEQRAIASVLGAIQEAKFARQKEIALERERKAALMEYLFSHGTKGEPRKQTEIGEIPESWKLVRLGSVAEITMGQSPKGDTYNTDGIGEPLINGPAEFGSKHPIPVQWTNKPTKLCKDGDVLFCVRGNTTGRMNIADQRYCIGRGIAAIREKTQISDTLYIRHLLEYERSSLYRIAIGGGSTFPNISTVHLKNYPVALPPLPEQCAIAYVWEAIDNRTAALEREVKHLDELFHAMLEDLMTGQRSAMPLIVPELLN